MGAPLPSDLPGLELFDGQVDKLFEAMATEGPPRRSSTGAGAVVGGSISKQGFKDLVRVFYKCVKATVMSSEISIKSKTIRRLEVGEARLHQQSTSKSQKMRIFFACHKLGPGTLLPALALAAPWQLHQVLEALATPVHEETTKVMRVQCVATQAPRLAAGAMGAAARLGWPWPPAGEQLVLRFSWI
eukprot:Skav205463  [mRNA]  locus=scaffold4885:192905:195697:+ [translate_table: standard]